MFDFVMPHIYFNINSEQRTIIIKKILGICNGNIPILVQSYFERIENWDSFRNSLQIPCYFNETILNTETNGIKGLQQIIF